MADITIAFIGVGNMATSIIGGLVGTGHSPESIRASGRSEEGLVRLREVAPVTTFASNAEAASGADIVIMAVKPKVMPDACASIAGAVRDSGALVVSLAAGVPIASLQQWLGGGVPVLRCMPNTPSLVGCGASGLYAASDVSEIQREHATRILSSVGVTCWVPEEDGLHALTAVSGSGPAYFFLFMEAMVAEGQRLGLDADTAAMLTHQTCLGAARMAAKSDVGLAELRRRVCSPGGTTERAVASFQAEGLGDLVTNAMRACIKRSREMTEEFS